VKRVIFTHAARQDLLEIWLYIAANNSEAVGDRVYDHIADSCRRLVEYPELGPSRPEIAEDARSLLVERWLVLYRLSGTDLQIVRIIDGARDLKRIDWLIDKSS
jgi:toxin ParE1/3/4